jgi:HD-GYP domain-containing protein (c-di-GMP phosphodiesterase class II)
MGPLLALQAFCFVSVCFLGFIGLAIPHVVPSVPAPGSKPAWAALVLGAALFAVLLWRALKTYLRTRRVAMRAVQVGEELGLPPGRLRDLAIGGLLHDIGKLSVPERILRKPGALDDDEFAAIKLHPGRGVMLLQELGGFGPAIHELVHSHHERLDGTGYPRGLDEPGLSLDTRILTVCDVYDALVSPRVYRDAWSHDDALALLRRDTGAAFDGRCVAALERVLEEEAARVVALPSRVLSARPSAAAAS